ncbi:ABC transporter substrate-binding protein [Rhodococcus sp. NPDC060176]|uniref:ABC transporter substrate-binding protein n=1 Tax=Rhodococcus sp. NPDC060176 TaxID=3347062 RepID=UPI00365C1C9E
MKFSKSGPLIATAAALAVLTGCSSATGAHKSGAGDDQNPVSGGTLVFSHDTDPACIDPQQAANWSLDLGRNIVDSLLDQNSETFEFTPWLASAYEANPTGTEFRFTIRDGVTFSDGTPLTADVVKANFDSIKNDLGAKATYVVGVFSSYLESVVEDNKVTVRFSSPNFPFIQAVSSPSTGILSAATLAKSPEARCQGAVVGTGPFVLDHYTPAAEVVLNKRNGYNWTSQNASHSGDAYLDSLKIQIVTEASVRDGSLLSGQVDGIRNPTEAQQATFSSSPFQSFTRPNPGIASSIDWNYKNSAIQDKNVRLAVLKGIDRSELQATVLGTHGLAATSILTSSTNGFTDHSDLLTYDRDGAAKLLEQSGWKPGSNGIREKDDSPLTIKGLFFDYQKPIAELQAQQLAKIGVKLDISLTTAANVGEKWLSGSYDFFQHANTAADPDILRGWFLTSLTSPARNFTETTTDLDRLLEQQPAVSNGPERDAIIDEIQTIVLQNAYAVPINQSVNVFAFSDQIHGVVLDAQSSSRFYDTWKVAK